MQAFSDLDVWVMEHLDHLRDCDHDLTLLPNAKSLDHSHLKAIADDKINVTEKLKFVLGRFENIVGKGENTGIQHFLLLSRIVWERLNDGSITLNQSFINQCQQRLTIFNSTEIGSIYS